MGPAKILWVGGDDEIKTSDVELQDFSEGGFGVMTDYKLPVGEVVWLERGPDELHRAIVRYSRHTGGLEWRTGLRVLERERRRESRDAVTGPAFLTWIADSGFRQSAAVIVTDISQTGVGVLAEQEAPVGVLVTLRGETLVCSGLVRHCRRDGDGYRVGILFTGRHKDRVLEDEREWLD